MVTGSPPKGADTKKAGENDRSSIGREPNMKLNRLFGLLVFAMLASSSCSLIGGDDEEASDDVTVEAGAGLTETTVPVATTAAPATTVADAVDGSGTLDDPRSILNATFAYTEDFYDTDWEGELYGLVDLPTNSSDKVGVCYGLVGIMSPVRIGEGSISEGFTAPDLGLVVDGVLVDDSFGCDADPVRDAGYGPIYDAQVTEGTEFAFYATFFVEGDPASAPVALSLGDSSDALQVQYFTTDVLGSVPAPVVAAGSGAGGDVEPLANAAFSYRGQFDDTTWDVQLSGVIEGEKDSFVDEAGSCLVLVGSLTPTQIDVGQLTDGFDSPDFVTVANGVQIEDESDCDVDAVELAGYGRLWDAEVTLGTVYPFYVGFFVPEGASAESIIAGDPTEDGGARFFSVDVIPALPAPDTSASLGTLPEGITPLTGAGFTYTDAFSETEWEALIDGLVPTEVDSFADVPGQCFAVVGVITPTAIPEGTVTDGFDTPDIGLIADGRSVAWNSFFCDDELLQANGYQDLTDAEVPVGTLYPYFVQFFVPGDGTATLDSVFIGDSAEDNALYYDAALLDAIPSRN